MKKITLLLVIGAFLFVGYKTLPGEKDNPPGTMSNGAPAASTGAPDEKHCSNIGCHSDFAPNSGVAEVSVTVGNGVQYYEPGKTYPVTVAISSPGLVRFGFQAVALKTSDNTNTGSLAVTDTERTRIIPGYGTLAERNYATYTYAGTEAVSVGLGKWTFEWTAPSKNEGDIAFYIGAVAANNDGTDGGDYTYLKRLVLLSPPVLWNVSSLAGSSSFRIEISGYPVEHLKIFSSKGEKILEKNNIEPGVLELELPQASGVYFVSAVQNGATSVQKIIISR